MLFFELDHLSLDVIPASEKRRNQEACLIPCGVDHLVTLCMQTASLVYALFLESISLVEVSENRTHLSPHSNAHLQSLAVFSSLNCSCQTKHVSCRKSIWICNDSNQVHSTAWVESGHTTHWATLSQKKIFFPKINIVTFILQPWRTN